MIRFGSFQICKGPDRQSGRDGPSAGQPDIVRQLADYVIRNFYPEVGLPPTRHTIFSLLSLLLALSAVYISVHVVNYSGCQSTFENAFVQCDCKCMSECYLL